jgi:hypothetical protein
VQLKCAVGANHTVKLRPFDQFSLLIAYFTSHTLKRESVSMSFDDFPSHVAVVFSYAAISGL